MPLILNKEKIYATILFLDVVDFTKAGDRQLSIIEALQERILRIFNRHGEEIDRILGNAFVPVFVPTGDGVLIVLDHDQKDAGIIEEVAGFTLKVAKAIVREARSLDFEIRLAISEGFIFRFMDINRRYNYAGTPINLCSRIMDFGDGSQILISQGFFEIVSRRFPRAETETQGSRPREVRFKAFEGLVIKHGHQIKLYQVLMQGLSSHVPERIQRQLEKVYLNLKTFRIDPARLTGGSPYSGELNLKYHDNLHVRRKNLVVFLPGIGQDHRDLIDQVEQISERCLAVTLCGFHPDDSNSAALTMEHHLDSLAQFVREQRENLEAERVIVVGFSIGADMVGELAKRPDMAGIIDGIVLLDGNLNSTTAEIPAALARLEEEGSIGDLIAKIIANLRANRADDAHMTRWLKYFSDVFSKENVSRTAIARVAGGIVELLRDRTTDDTIAAWQSFAAKGIRTVVFVSRERIESFPDISRDHLDVFHERNLNHFDMLKLETIRKGLAKVIPG